MSTSLLAFTLADANADTLFTFGASSGNTALVDASGILLGGSGTARTVTLTPALNQFGTASVTLTVGDGALTATRNFVLTVNSVNDAPTVTAIAPQSTNEDTALSGLAFTVGDVETAAGALVVTATSSNQTLVPNANLVLAGANAAKTLSLTPAANQNGPAAMAPKKTPAESEPSAWPVLETVV